MKVLEGVGIQHNTAERYHYGTIISYNSTSSTTIPCERLPAKVQKLCKWHLAMTHLNSTNGQIISHSRYGTYHAELLPCSYVCNQKQLSVGGSLPEHWMNDRRKANPLQQKRAPCHGYFYRVSGQCYHSRTTPHQTDVVFYSRANQGAKAAGYRQYG